MVDADEALSHNGMMRTFQAQKKGQVSMSGAVPLVVATLFYLIVMLPVIDLPNTSG